MKYTWCRLGSDATFAKDLDYFIKDVDVESEKLGGHSVVLSQGQQTWTGWK